MSGPKPRKEMFHGLFGEYAKAISGDAFLGGTNPPRSEVSPVAVLFQSLTTFGALVGNKVFLRVDAKKHHPALFSLIIGSSSRARKGSSLEHVLNLFDDEFKRFETGPLVAGLSSGEGLVMRLTEPDNENEGLRKNRKENQSIIILSEFASMLQVKRREGNTLSPLIRDAWDSRPLEILTKHSPMKCTNYHLGLIGHITLNELQTLVGATDYSNGLLNRFLFVYVQRHAVLPNPPGLGESELANFKSRVRTLMESVSQISEVKMTRASEDIWTELYTAITTIEDENNKVEDMIARSEAYVLRLALIYALSDGKSIIEPEHLFAAYAAWGYCYNSTKFILNNYYGLAKKIIKYLKEQVVAVNKTDLFNAFNNNVSKQDLDRTLQYLVSQQIIAIYPETTNGRPRECINLIGEDGRYYERYEFTN